MDPAKYAAEAVSQVRGKIESESGGTPIQLKDIDSEATVSEERKDYWNYFYQLLQQNNSAGVTHSRTAFERTQTQFMELVEMGIIPCPPENELFKIVKQKLEKDFETKLKSIQSTHQGEVDFLKGKRQDLMCGNQTLRNKIQDLNTRNDKLRQKIDALEAFTSVESKDDDNDDE